MHSNRREENERGHDRVVSCQSESDGGHVPSKLEERRRTGCAYKHPKTIKNQRKLLERYRKRLQKMKKRMARQRHALLLTRLCRLEIAYRNRPCAKTRQSVMRLRAQIAQTI